MRNGNRLNPAIYLQAIPLLFRHLSIMVAPLLAAVVSVLLNQLGQLMTDPVGGVGAGLYTFIGQTVYLIAFATAVIQAHNIWRGYDGSFDAAWRETKGKLGGIALAAVGFTFLLNVAAQIGAILGPVSILLQRLVAFLLIYTMPAAAIGGQQAGYAIQASYRAAIAHPWATALLAAVFVICTLFVPLFLGPLYGGLPSIAVQLIAAAIYALLLSYLAFPFAKQYDDIA